jgi:hypothetical protein
MGFFFSNPVSEPMRSKILSDPLPRFICPHHMRMPKRFGAWSSLAILVCFFQTCKQELEKAIGIGEHRVFDPVLGKVLLIHLHKLRRQGNI